MHSPATLPNEIIIEVSSHLSLGQKSNFSRTCKRLDALIEPQIWSDLELHAEGYHDSRDELKHPPPFKSPLDGVYRCYHYRGGVSPLNTLRQLVETHDQDRLRILASRVRSLCSVIDTGDKICPTVSTSRPIQTSLWFDRDLAPLPEENLAGPNEAPDYGSLNCELVHPRPLGGFLPEEGVSLPLLQHLYLFSTAHRKHTYYAEDEGWSSRAEEASSQDWIDVLMASRQTLETLVLEHKLTILESETEDRGEEEIMRDFHTNNDGGGSSKLANVLEAVTIHDAEEFPELTHVYFYGIVESERRIHWDEVIASVQGAD
ncbi:hypothetical protein CEP53_010700 [Fusarium sp. AF-6]|nr:hypothetical protein CEP53_010700 [Fusarium sp. AF-6]